MESSLSHLHGDTGGGSKDHGEEGCWYFSVEVELEASEIILPPGVELPEEGTFHTDIKEGDGPCHLHSAFESISERLQISGGLQEVPALLDICGWLVVLEHEVGVVD